MAKQAPAWGDSMIADGYTLVPPGKIASVVTYLEMRQAPQIAASERSGLAMRRVTHVELEWYRALYKKIGAEWLWFSRLQLNDAELRQLFDDERYELWVLRADGVDAGLLELDRRVPAEIEISYFGVASELIGGGVGKFLLNHALRAAWEHRPDRVWLHTCNLDHPRALGFYRAAGFVPYQYAIEVSEDPRLTGLLPETAAPHAPIIR